MFDKNHRESRRKLLRSIAASGGAVATGKMMPESWTKPVIDTVLLPAHAQTSVRTGPSRATFSQTLSSGELCPAALLGTGTPVPDPAPFLFDWATGGFTPTGDGTLTVTANGDITGNELTLEAWQIRFNSGSILTPLVGNTGGPGQQDTDTQIYTITQADLTAAGPGLNVPVTAENLGRIDCDTDIVNNLTFVLTFPATI